MFDDIKKLKLGDKFYIHVLDEVLAYKVDNIKVVLPNEVESLKIDKDNDYITLVTCTPYMINTHRLLVRGTRTELESTDENITNENNIQKEKQQLQLYIIIIVIGIIIILLIMLILLIVIKRKPKYKGKHR